MVNTWPLYKIITIILPYFAAFAAAYPANEKME